MAIELILEGQLEKESDREIFSETLKQLCEEKKIKIEDYDTTLVMDVCPQGYIECSYEGIFISIVAQTNVAGPGFHAFVAEFYDAIMLESGIVFEVGDATQYYENRDFESLKYKYFYPWLSQICAYVKEHGHREKDICICWDLENYRPANKDGYVVTPLGYQRIEDFQELDTERLAQQFFIWNQQTRDAAYFRNCALALLWKDCFFEYSTMNDHTSKISNMIIDYIEAAYDEDSTISLPFAIYTKLCDTLHREKNIHMSNEYTQGLEIGFRKGIVFYTIGNWSLAVQGFQEKTFDTVTQTLNIMAPYKLDDEPWTWLIKANVMDDKQLRAVWMKQQDTYESIQNKDVLMESVVLHEEEYYRLFVQVVKEDETLQMDCYIRDEKDIAKIKSWCAQCVYSKRSEIAINH